LNIPLSLCIQTTARTGHQPLRLIPTNPHTVWFLVLTKMAENGQNGKANPLESF
jgi:hypothetical protein